jgi:hypothetical protein
MDLDLDRMLETTREGQWSVDEFDWSQPLQGADGLSRKQRREAGLALLFTAGLERQAARIFRLNAQFVEDERAKQIYELFYDDEMRHAEAEIRLARRYDTEWEHLPFPVRWMFKTLEKNFDEADLRGVHELSSATIVLFELALDSLLIPALKEKSSDELQAAVFRRIDIDESRHLAMDYWLLDEKGKVYQGRSIEELFRARHGRDRSLRERIAGNYKMLRVLVALLAGFGTLDFVAPSMRESTMKPELMGKYLRRVRAIEKKAPHAMEVATFRTGLKGQAIIMNTMSKLSGRGAFDKEAYLS